jgi:hypothetical protein
MHAPCTSAAATLPQAWDTESALESLHAAARHIDRARVQAGSRLAAWELLDAAAHLDAGLAAARPQVSARFGEELPLPVRRTLGALRHAIQRMGELGTAGTCVVTTQIGDVEALSADLTAWAEEVQGLVELVQGAGSPLPACPPLPGAPRSTVAHPAQLPITSLHAW